MSDIHKIRETKTKEEGNWDDWPYPTLEIESVITGELREKILAKLSCISGDKRKLTLIERQVSAGYSEYTQEDECSIMVRLGVETRWSDEWNYSQESAMVNFLNWIGE